MKRDDDPFTGPEWETFVTHVLDDMAPKVRRSQLFACLVPDDRRGDVKFWVELGAAIMMDKPIIAVIFDGLPIPERLRRVADDIVVIDRHKLDDRDEISKIANAITRVTEAQSAHGSE